MNLVDLARVGRSISLGVWLGASIMVFVAAPIVFEKLAPDRSRAGEIVGAILHSAALLCAGLAVVALLSQGLLFFNDAESGWKRYTTTAALLAALALMAVLLIWIGPRIESVRQQIGVFTPENENSPERQLFRKLHGASMGLSLLQTICVAIAFVAGLL